MEPNWNEIAKRLRISREKVPMEKDEAATLIGLTRRALQNHETGARVNPRLIKRYASIYKVDPHWLMTGLGALYLLVVLILLGRCSYYLGKILKELTLRPKDPKTQ
jgi:DNA-binding XRE family transcriptional regulator